MKNSGAVGRSELALERRQKAWALRLQGLSVRAIADVLNVSHTAVEKMLQRTISELHRSELGDADSARLLELERLDVLQASLWQGIMEGNVPAVAQVIAISARRAKLLGLDAPIKSALTNVKGDGDIGNSIAAAATALNSRLADLITAAATDEDTKLPDND